MWKTKHVDKPRYAARLALQSLPEERS
jgi:hypothetical protein